METGSARPRTAVFLSFPVREFLGVLLHRTAFQPLGVPSRRPQPREVMRTEAMEDAPLSDSWEASMFFKSRIGSMILLGMRRGAS